MAKEETKMEKIISLCKRRGFIFQGSEVYGGLSGTWDFAHYGLLLKNNIKNLWWKRFVKDRSDMYGVDAAILMNQNVWKASGHVSGFSDPLVECKKCGIRFRVDSLISNTKSFEDLINVIKNIVDDDLKNLHDKIDEPRELIKYSSKLSNEVSDSVIKEIQSIIADFEDSLDFVKKANEQLKLAKQYTGSIVLFYLNKFEKCSNCGSSNWNTPKKFNMMFKTNAGPIEGDVSVTYLRPETAQGMFVNFKNVLDSIHPTLPFGLAQIGKAFRNEIAPRDFIFRSREFEQMEIEYFVKPDDWKVTFEDFVNEIHSFTTDIGLDNKHVHELEVADGDRAHYSKRTIDFEFDFPFGKKELYGLAYRTDFDLKAHSEASKVDLSYFDEETKTRFIPHCIEPSFGVERTVLAVLSDAYTEDEIDGEKRVYMKFSPKVAPIKVAVFPLLKNKPQLVEKAKEVFVMLKKEIDDVVFDDNGNIGKRYRRQDEIGTPYCVTVDFDTVEKDSGVTVRNRDTGKQERVKIEELTKYLKI